jgi:hypothetical protein
VYNCFRFPEPPYRGTDWFSVRALLWFADIVLPFFKNRKRHASKLFPVVTTGDNTKPRREEYPFFNGDDFLASLDCFALFCFDSVCLPRSLAALLHGGNGYSYSDSKL